MGLWHGGHPNEEDFNALRKFVETIKEHHTKSDSDLRD